ncbi:MAG: hypothetical protein AB7M05_06450 [Alphaproteobacteria bacterium]
MESDTLTSEQQALVDLFDRHVRAEFEQHDVTATMATMTPAPHLNHVPVMTGGRNRAEVQDFYAHDFIPGLRRTRTTCRLPAWSRPARCKRRPRSRRTP